VNNLVRQGEVDRAYRLWREFGKIPDSGAGKGLYDPGFRGLPGSAPFNWSLTAGAEGVAERASGGTLQASYYGRTDLVLAEQLLMLQPGRYRLQFDAEGDAKGEDSKLAWTLTCLGSNAQLVQVPLAGVTFTPRTLGASFSVPASGCRAQWLRLGGGAAEFPSEQAVTIRNLKLAGAGS
jgi:hypothetical protein